MKTHNVIIRKIFHKIHKDQIASKTYNHVSINTGSYIDHDNTFHNFSGTGPGVATGGNVIVGEQSFLDIP